MDDYSNQVHLKLFINSQSIKLQKGSRDTCLLANCELVAVHMHPSAGYQLSSSEPDNNHAAADGCIETDICGLADKCLC